MAEKNRYFGVRDGEAIITFNNSSLNWKLIFNVLFFTIFLFIYGSISSYCFDLDVIPYIYWPICPTWIFIFYRILKPIPKSGNKETHEFWRLFVYSLLASGIVIIRGTAPPFSHLANSADIAQSACPLFFPLFISLLSSDYKTKGLFAKWFGEKVGNRISIVYAWTLWILYFAFLGIAILFFTFVSGWCGEDRQVLKQLGSPDKKIVVSIEEGSGGCGAIGGHWDFNTVILRKRTLFGLQFKRELIDLREFDDQEKWRMEDQGKLDILWNGAVLEVLCPRLPEHLTKNFFGTEVRYIIQKE